MSFVTKALMEIFKYLKASAAAEFVSLNASALQDGCWRTGSMSAQGPPNLILLHMSVLFLLC